MTKETVGEEGGVMIKLGMRKRGTGPLSLETCPLPEEPRMIGFLKMIVTITKYGKIHIKRVR